MATFETYDIGDFFHELIDAEGRPRPGAELRRPISSITRVGFLSAIWESGTNGSL